MPTDPNCIFCKIIAGQVPSWKVYEDDRVFAFLDIGPLSTGHTLIIPKSHYERLEQMPADEAGACIAVAPKLAGAVLGTTGAPGWNLVQNNGKIAHQAVGHVHFHIIPRTEDSGVSLGWDVRKLDEATARRLQDDITARLS